GAMSGTPAGDWQLGLNPASIPDLLTDAAVLGFCAVEVDTAAYLPGGPGPLPTSPVARLVDVAGPPIAATSDGRLVSFAVPSAGLEHEAADQRLRQVLEPVLVSVGGQPGYQAQGS